LLPCHSINQEEGEEEADSRDGDSEGDNHDISGERERNKHPTYTASHLQTCHDVAANLDVGHHSNYIISLHTFPESEIL